MSVTDPPRPRHVPAIVAGCQSPERALDPAPSRARPLTGGRYWATGPCLAVGGTLLGFFFFFIIILFQIPPVFQMLSS